MNYLETLTFINEKLMNEFLKKNARFIEYIDIKIFSDHYGTSGTLKYMLIYKVIDENVIYSSKKLDGFSSVEDTSEKLNDYSSEEYDDVEFKIAKIYRELR